MKECEAQVVFVNLILFVAWNSFGIIIDHSVHLDTEK